MKKLWVMALGSAALLLQTASLYAAEIKFEGDFRVRGIYTNNLSDANKSTPDEQAFADGRFRLKTTATAGITSGVVVLDFTSAFPDPTVPSGACGTCTTGNYRFGTANFGGSYNIVGVREAHLDLDLHFARLVLGRQAIKLGHSLILDDTVDAIVAKFMVGPAHAMLADAKLFESNGLAHPTGGATGSDTDLYIAKIGFSHEDMHNLGIFATYFNDRNPTFLPAPAGTSDKTTFWTVGVTADGRFGPINLGAELDYLSGTADVTAGTSTDLRGWNALVNAGLKVAMVDVGVTGLYTSGQKNENKINVNGISGDFVLANILVNDNVNSDREGQCASIGGARFGSGGASCVGGLGILAVKVSGAIDGLLPMWKGSRSEIAAIWAQTAEEQFVTVGPTTVTGKKDLGIEVDLNHRQKLDDNVAVNVNLGYLFVGDFFKGPGGAGPGDEMYKGIISVNYMF